MSETKRLIESIQNHLNESEETNLNIESVIPNYTGGNIYNYTGKLSDGNYFMAADDWFEGDYFDIRIVNENPDKVGEDSWYPEWQEEHLVRDIQSENEAQKFTKQILNWIIKNKPEGNYDISDMENMLKCIKPMNESVQNYRDINRTKDEWKLIIDPSVKNINDIKNNYNAMKHNATWYEYSEIMNILNNYQDKETRLKLLNQLKTDIDTNIKYATDYEDASPEAINLWLKCYKEYIDEFINKLNLEGKYYIKIQLTTYDGNYEDHSRDIYLNIDNGKFKMVYPPKYYNSEAEAQTALDSLNKSELDNYIKNNYLGEYTTDYNWDIDIYEYRIS